MSGAPIGRERPLELVVVSSRRTSIRLLVLTALMFGTFLLAVPSASAANCGKALVNEYFFSGRLKYHTQECYASALKQVDPDARMYSGIMGAIRAARARDQAADRKAAAPTVDPGTATSAPPVDTQPVPDAVPPTLTTDSGTVTAEPRSGAVVPIQTTQAALPMVTAPSQVPLSVILLAGLAIVLMLVGIGGLTVRWLDRSS